MSKNLILAWKKFFQEQLCSFQRSPSLSVAKLVLQTSPNVEPKKELVRGRYLLPLLPNAEKKPAYPGLDSCQPLAPPASAFLPARKLLVKLPLSHACPFPPLFFLLLLSSPPWNFLSVPSSVSLSLLPNLTKTTSAKGCVLTEPYT